MSNSRGFRRHLQPVAERSTHEMRELSGAEIAAMTEEWEALTDEVVRLIAAGATDEATERSDTARREIAVRYGGASLVVGPVSSATHLAGHVLAHVDGLGELGDALESVDALGRRNRMGPARRLAQAILADAAGLEGAGPEGLVELVDGAGEDAGPIASAVWAALCAVGAEHGIGARWCAVAGDYEDYVDEDDEDDEDGGWDDIEEAREDAGAAAVLVGLVGAGQGVLAVALAETIAGEVLLPDGVAGCLALLDLDDEPDEATLRRVCAETTEARIVDDVCGDEDADEMLAAATRVAARLGGGMEAGVEALERLERWLGAPSDET